MAEGRGIGISARRVHGSLAGKWPVSKKIHAEKSKGAASPRHGALLHSLQEPTVETQASLPQCMAAWISGRAENWHPKSYFP